MFSDELNAIARDRGATVHYLLGSRDQLGQDPLSAERLNAPSPACAEHDVYVCGPAGMTGAVDRARCGRPGSRAGSIHHETFEF